MKLNNIKFWKQIGIWASLIFGMIMLLQSNIEPLSKKCRKEVNTIFDKKKKKLGKKIFNTIPHVYAAKKLGKLFKSKKLKKYRKKLKKF